GSTAAGIRNRRHSAIHNPQSAMTIYPFKFLLGPLTITGYGLMMMVAFLMAGWAIQLDLRQWRMNEDYAADIVFAAVVGGIIGAKIWYVLLTGEWDALFRRGGFVWYGGFLGGVAGVLLNGWRQGIPARWTMELAAHRLALRRLPRARGRRAVPSRVRARERRPPARPLHPGPGYQRAAGGGGHLRDAAAAPARRRRAGDPAGAQASAHLMRRLPAVALTALALAACARGRAGPPELILTGGRIFPADPARPWPEAP